MKKAKTKLAGLYGITDSSLLPTSSSLFAAVEAALQGGMRILQYRAKILPDAEKRRQAERLKQLCADYRALFIINDDVTLAAAVDADGVHLGKNDSDIKIARQQLGDDKIIGASCYNRLELALQAQQMGFDYVAFGRFFPSQTKPEAVQADPHILQQAASQLSIPLCAIGGIQPSNAALLIEQGADMIAVIHALFSAADIRQRAADFSSLFPRF
jgi:thiamine-phosphate pyrophosphorylase